MLTIGQLAAHVGVTVKAVRHYHRLGLLPEPVRDEAGYRRYDAQAVIDLTRIKILRDAGIPLREIPALLGADHDALATTIDQIERDLDARIEALKSRKALVRQLAAGDSLYLAPAVVTLLDYLRGLGVPEPVVALERDGWIIWSVTSPDLVERWAQLKLQNLADPDVSERYLMIALAAAWSPDDPRLVDLAHHWAAARLAAKSEGGEIDYQQLESLNPTTIALVADRFARTSPAFARLTELAQQLLATADGKPRLRRDRPSGVYSGRASRRPATWSFRRMSAPSTTSSLPARTSRSGRDPQIRRQPSCCRPTTMAGAARLGISPGKSVRSGGGARCRRAPRGVSSMVEQRTFNPWVLGSSPRRPTSTNTRSDWSWLR